MSHQRDIIVINLDPIALNIYASLYYVEIEHRIGQRDWSERAEGLGRDTFGWTSMSRMSIQGLSYSVLSRNLNRPK
jgi:hypothetical protein